MIRAKFARMVVYTYALESMVYLTAGLIDRGLEDYALEGACCKIFGTETVWNTSTTPCRSRAATASWRSIPSRRRSATPAST